MKAQERNAACHYFVDESGDGVIFDAGGRVILGSHGCMNHFILGMLEVRDSAALAAGLETIRAELVADPWFAGVPSFDPASGKTAVCFHAKDDLPEVRREVFRFLATQDVKFFAVVKNMWQVLEYVRSRNLTQPEYRYRPDELYDLTVRMLFRNRLHLQPHYVVCFAKRGARDRTQQLRQHLEEARRRFAQKWDRDIAGTLQVVPKLSRDEAGLQAADYFLWALQRLYERREDRYLNMLWGKVGLVHDVDDKRSHEYGVYYTQKRPLTAGAVSKPGGV